MPDPTSLCKQKVALLDHSALTTCKNLHEKFVVAASFREHRNVPGWHSAISSECNAATAVLQTRETAPKLLQNMAAEVLNKLLLSLTTLEATNGAKSILKWWCSLYRSRATQQLFSCTPHFLFLCAALCTAVAIMHGLF